MFSQKRPQLGEETSANSESSDELDELLGPISETTSEVARSVSTNKSSPRVSDTIFDVQKAMLVVNLINERSVELQQVQDNMAHARKEIFGQINQTTKTIKQVLDLRQQQLEHDLETHLDRHLKEIKELLHDFEFRSQRLNLLIENHSNNHNVTNLNSIPNCNGTDTEILENLMSQQKKNVIMIRKEEADYLINGPICMHPSEGDTLSFSPSGLDRLLGNIKSMGSIGISSADPESSYLEENKDEIGPLCVRKCKLNESVECGIISKDFSGKEVINTHLDDYSVTLNPRENFCSEARIVKNVTKEDEKYQQFMKCFPSKVKLVYSLGTPGIYEMNVKILGEHIKGSPYTVWCKKPRSPQADEWLKAFEEAGNKLQYRRSIFQSLRRYNSTPKLSFWQDVDALNKELEFAKSGNIIKTIPLSPIPKNNELCHIQGCWITRDGHIIIVDEDNRKLLIFDLEGEFKLSFGETGHEPGQMMKPMDVAETINGNYLISDFELHCVNVFTPKGKYISRFGQRYLTGPKGIAVDSKGRILVVDQRACGLCIFKPTGKFINRFGTRGQDDVNFVVPTFVAVNHVDEIFITDAGGNSIKVFDHNGIFVSSICRNGILPGQIHHPMGIAVDLDDNLYIVDQANGRIQIITRTEKHIINLDFGMQKLEYPVGIALTKDEHKIVVTDSNLQFFFLCRNPIKSQ